jgi:hypothetical protein
MKKIICLLAVMIMLAGVAWAANDVTSLPWRVDTFGADVTLKNNRFMLEKMVITAYTSAKTVTFINDTAAAVLVLEVPAGQTISWPSTDIPVVFPNGFIFDDSESDLAAGDFIFIWGK